MLGDMTIGRLAFHALLGYGGATFFSYKYNKITKAQEDLKAIQDKKLFLMEKHNQISETYNSMFAKREFSQKLHKFRTTLLSYAEGDVLECGVGTGNTLGIYNTQSIKSYIGIDWSSGMLEKAFETVDETCRDGDAKNDPRR